MFKTTSFLALGFVVAMAGRSQAKEVLSFEPDPISDPAPGFQWDGTTLTAGSGMTSNGDGNNEAPGGNGIFTKPGLRIEVPFVIHGVSSSSPTATTTTFFDSSMSVTGLTAVGNATNVGGLLIQNLTAGGFTIMSSNDTVGGAVLLLSGTIGDASLSGINDSNTGSVISATVTYLGGLVFNQMLASGLGTTGSRSASLVDIIPTLSINPATHHLSAFSSNSSGLFDTHVTAAVPTPGALPVGLALIGGYGLLRRKTRVA